MKLDWKAQIGIAVILIAILFFAGFYTHKWTRKVEVRELIQTDIKWLPAVELKYQGKASLSDVQLKSIPIHIIRTVDTVKHPLSGLVRVAGFDSLYSDSTRISGEYYFPPVNQFDIRYSIPQRPDTTFYYETQKIIREYPLFNHGVVVAAGYSPFTKKFDGFIGYGVTLHLQNLFK